MFAREGASFERETKAKRPDTESKTERGEEGEETLEGELIRSAVWGVCGHGGVVVGVVVVVVIASGCGKWAPVKTGQLLWRWGVGCNLWMCVCYCVCTCPLHVSFGVFVCVTTSVLVVAAPGMPHGSAGCSTCHVLTQIWTDSLE